MPTVYWAPAALPDTFASRVNLAWEEPESLYKELNQELKPYLQKGPDFSNFLLCPAVRNSTSRTYVIKSPIEYSLLWDGENITSQHYDQFAFNSLTYVRDKKAGYMSLNLKLIFFSDESIMMNQYPAYSSKSSFSENTRMFQGSYDISNWFRPIDIPFMFRRKDVKLDINVGDPLYYVTFDTNEKVTFKRFTLTHDLWEYAAMCMNLKEVDRLLGLQTLYRKFKAARLHKIITSRIKEQTKE